MSRVIPSDAEGRVEESLTETLNNYKLIITKKNNMEKTKNLIGEGSYNAPELIVIDLQTEGVLCASGNGVFQDFLEEEI